MARSGVELLSNVCRHRQAIMLNGRGKPNRNIVCPLHRWTYDLKGDAAGRAALRRAALPEPGPLARCRTGAACCSKARATSPPTWPPGPASEFDFDGYLLDHVEVHECDYNWKTFIEVYLEDYHVAPFHPGLGRFVSCEDLDWHFGDWYSVQTVGMHAA
jgi:choline monooxygenase